MKIAYLHKKGNRMSTEEKKNETPAAEAVETQKETAQAAPEAETKVEAKEEKAETSGEEKLKALEAEKLELQEKLLAAKQESTTNREQLDKLQTQFEEMKTLVAEQRKKNMTKEELEAEERKELNKKLTDSEQLIEQLKSENRKKDLSIKKQAIAMQHGIPSDMLDLVHGESEDELKLRCQKLAKAIKTASTPDTVPINEVTTVGTQRVSDEENTGGQATAVQPARNKTESFADVRSRINGDPQLKARVMERLGIKG